MIIVTGTGRSGTSMVAGILHNLGVNMGQNALDADYRNPWGHFEDKDIKLLNHKMLKSKITPSEFINKLKSSEKKEPWGIKDPRISELIPYYLEVFKNAKYIWCKRRRVNVVKSLMSSYNWSKKDAQKLHDKRLSNLSLLDGQKLLVINYENKKDIVKKIANFTGMQITQEALHFVKKSVLVTFPTSPANPFLHKHTVFSSWKLLKDPRYKIKMIIPTHNPFENNLHHIVNQFIKEDHDYWLSIDFDNPPIQNPLDLIEFDKDIMGLPTPVSYHNLEEPGTRPIYYNVYKFVSKKKGYTEWPEKKGLQEVDAIGTGCFLINRRVFLNEKMRNAPFQRIYNKDGTVEYGNDLAFSQRAKKQGFEIWAHFDYPCRHFSRVELNEMVMVWSNFYNKINKNG